MAGFGDILKIMSHAKELQENAAKRLAAVREYATVEQIYFPSIRLPWASFKSFFSEVPVLAAIL